MLNTVGQNEGLQIWVRLDKDNGTQASRPYDLTFGVKDGPGPPKDKIGPFHCRIPPTDDVVSGVRPLSARTPPVTTSRSRGGKEGTLSRSPTKNDLQPYGVPRGVAPSRWDSDDHVPLPTQTLNCISDKVSDV